MKHTPGPWYATGPHVQSAVLNEDNYICKAEGNSEKEIEANAKLIAAAPDMLAALKECITKDGAACFNSNVEIKRRLDYVSKLAVETIKKAEGV